MALAWALGSGTLLAQPASVSSAFDLIRPEAVGASIVSNRATAAIIVDGKLQGLVDDLIARSTAFRRQWQRLSRQPRLTLRIELVHHRHVLDAHAATTVVVQPDGSQEATVAVPASTRLAELVAHEVEHVLERLDGVRVATQHSLGDGSVRKASGTFETARAVLVGQVVAAEFRPR